LVLLSPQIVCCAFGPLPDTDGTPMEAKYTSSGPYRHICFCFLSPFLCVVCWFVYSTDLSLSVCSVSRLGQSWDVFFRNANAGAPPGAAYQSPLGLTLAAGAALAQGTSVGAQPNVEKLVEDHLAVQSLIRAYQVHTHIHAHRGDEYGLALIHNNNILMMR